MLEKRFPVVPPQDFIADGTPNGIVTIPDTTLFKVKEKVMLAATAQPTLDNLEVKNVLSKTQLVVGPQGGSILKTTDISAYTVAANAAIFYPSEQLRPPINQDEYERAVYEEEPVVAKRVILVDKLGNRFDSVTGVDGVVRLAVDAEVSQAQGTIPSIWDEIDITYNANKSITKVEYIKASAVERTLDLTLDADDDITKVTAT